MLPAGDDDNNINNNNNNNNKQGDGGAHQGDRGDRTEGGGEGKVEGGERGEEIFAHRRVYQSKVVQEVFTDLKRKYF